MPTTLSGVNTPDAYNPSCSFQPDKNTKQIVFVGTGADYYVQIYKLNPHDLLSQPLADGVERFYPAGTGDNFVGPIGGAFFRSAVSGVPAAIYGQQAFATDVLSSAPAFGGGPSCCGGMSGLDTTDGVTDVNPTTQLLIGSGITLSNPSSGVARLDAAGGFLDEQTAAVDGDPLSFATIPNGYRHLRVEFSVQTISANQEDSLQVQFGDTPTPLPGQAVWSDADDQEYAYTSSDVAIPGVPGRAARGYSTFFAKGEIDFPYYAQEAAVIANYQVGSPASTVSGNVAGIGALGIGGIAGPIVAPLALIPLSNVEGNDGVVIGGSTDFNAASGNFTPGIVGSTINIYGIHAYGFTITAVISPTELTLDNPWPEGDESGLRWDTFVGGWAAGSIASLYGIR